MYVYAGGELFWIYGSGTPPLLGPCQMEISLNADYMQLFIKLYLYGLLPFDM